MYSINTLNRRNNADLVTPLEVACVAWHGEVVEKMLSASNVDANLPDKNGQTPMHVAAMNGTVDILVELLKREDIDVNRYLFFFYFRARKKGLYTWLREISSCSRLTFLPGPAWLLLNKVCKPLFRALYMQSQFLLHCKYSSRRILS